jgi:hypothetical protein
MRKSIAFWFDPEKSPDDALDLEESSISHGNHQRKIRDITSIGINLDQYYLIPNKYSVIFLSKHKKHLSKSESASCFTRRIPT